VKGAWKLKVSFHRIIERFGLEGTLQTMQFQPPWHGQGPLPPDQTRLVRVLSNLALNPAREGAATASRGSLTTLTVKNFFLIPNVNRHFPSLLILVEESVGSGEEASD